MAQAVVTLPHEPGIHVVQVKLLNNTRLNPAGIKLGSPTRVMP